MLCRYVLILHGLRQFLGAPEYTHHIHPHAEAVRAAHAWNTGDLFLQPSLQHRQINAADIKDGCKQPFRLLRECEQHMCRSNFLMIAHGCNLLRRLERRQRSRCVFILFHNVSLHHLFLSSCSHYNR